MHKIYFEHRCLAICLPEEVPSSVPAGEIRRISSRQDAAALAEAFKSGTAPETVHAVCGDTGTARKLLYGEFREVNAAGGVVTDDTGRFLLIRRNSLWDLPKGHQEEGEDIRDTALREVEEETGVSGLRPGELICITDHCYLRDGIWHLKHTWWYAMSYDGKCALTPQTEEGISEVTMVLKEDLGALLEDTYPSIREVFRTILGQI